MQQPLPLPGMEQTGKHEGHCEKCPLRDGILVPTEMGKPGGLLLVGEGPGTQEVRAGRPFVGRSGKVLRRILRELGIEDCTITNAVLCGPQKPDSRAVVACRKHLRELVRQINPQVVVALGNTALQACVPGGTTGRITQFHGRRIWSEQLGCWVAPVPHPAATLYHPQYLPLLKEGLEMATRPLVAPPRIQVKAGSLAAGLRGVIGLDIETTSLDPRTGQLVVVGTATKDAAVVTPAEKLTPADFRQLRAPLIMHNVMFDAKWILHHYGVQLRAEDTMLMQHLLDERRGACGLKTMVASRLGWEDYSRGVAEARKKGDWTLVDRDELYRYVALDALAPVLMFDGLMRELRESELDWLYREVMLPAAQALLVVELHGVPVDCSWLEQFERELDEEIQQHQSCCWEEVGKPFNLRSPNGVKHILAQRGIMVDTTNAGELEKFADDPLVKHLIAARKALHSKSTWVDGLRGRIVNGRVYTHFNLVGSRTGRIAGSRPNFLNIKRGRVRKLVAAKNAWIVQVDASQSELRCLAALSGDPWLCEIFREGRDLHSETSRLVFGSSDPAARRMAKNINFGFIYSLGNVGMLSWRFGLEPAVAKRVEQLYRSHMAGVYDWIEREWDFVVRHGYAVTPFGRRRRFPGVSPNDHQTKKEAINFLPQSWSSDINLLVVSRLDSDLLALVILPVYDSIVLEVPGSRNDAIAVGRRVAQLYEEIGSWALARVPMKVDVSVGPNWGELQTV